MVAPTGEQADDQGKEYGRWWVGTGAMSNEWSEYQPIDTDVRECDNWYGHSTKQYPTNTHETNKQRNNQATKQHRNDKV
jgi:hypothetical protein